MSWVTENRFQVLDSLDTIDNTIASCKTVPEAQTMSEPPEPSSYNPPPRIHIRSTSLKTSTHLQIELQTIDTGARVTISALLDSGATGLFLDSEFVKGNHLNTRRLPRAIPVYNVDGTANQGGSIQEEIDMIMSFQGHSERTTFAVCSLGSKTAIVGHTWLQQHNPEVNWQTGEITMSRCPSNCRVQRAKARQQKKQLKRTDRLPKLLPDDDDDEDCPQEELLTEGDRIFVTVLEPWNEVNAFQNISQRLAEQAHKGERVKTFEEIVPRAYHNFKDIFSKESFDELPPKKPWDHAIELKPGSEPHSSKIYPLALNEQAELDTFLDENLKSGRIRSSKSPMAAPVFFIKKKDGGLRLIQDYRKLNEMTIKNTYPLPLISELVNKLRKAKIFTKLDVRWGYNNVRIKEGDEWKAAFRTNRGLYEPLVMFFGLTNSPATFQTMMNDIFKELIDEGVVVVYLDDILIFTATLEEHQEVVKRVLKVMRDNKLYLKPEKCSFEQDKVEYLGLIISANKIEMDPVKVEGVSQWPTPTNVKEVQSFLGFVNFYRRFIQDFANIAKPLHNLTKKDLPWMWSKNEQEAFNHLKQRVTTSPILIFPDDNKPFKVEADSSDYATGAVLSQQGNDDKWHPVAFLSKSLSAVERNYDIHDKEMLAIIRALEEWRHYLEGARHTFEIWTDHKNLEYFMTAKKLNRRQARWSLFLSQFDFQLNHRPGNKSMKPDALSRRSDHGRGENDNDNIVLLKPQYFQILATRQGHVIMTGAENSILKTIRQSKDYDESVVKAVEELKHSSTKKLHGEEWSMEQGLILYRGKIYVPKNETLRREVVQAHHDSPVTGHPGRWKTLELVTRNYWWPNISRYIANYVKGCDRCNRTKTFPAKPMGKLTPTEIPDGPWQTITTDLIIGLPDSQGYNAIMVVVDRFTKMIHVLPTTDQVSSEGIARLFRDNVWRYHGLPIKVISDRGSQFVSGYMRELNRLLGIQTAASTAYQPQTDGQTERINQEIELYLRMFVNYRQDDWMDWLPLAEFCYNNRIQSSTRQTPFMLNYGRHPRLGTEPVRETNIEAVEDFLQRMKAIQTEAKSALEQAATDMAKFYDIHRESSPNYGEGDKVWLEGKDIKTSRPSKKLEDKRYGPYKIKKQISPNAYKLQLPKSWKIHPVFHTSRLRPYNEDLIPGRKPPTPPEPVVMGESPEWEVERIDDSRKRYRKLQFLVKWKGYPNEARTWEPEENVANAKKCIRDFYQQHPSAIRNISL